VFDNDGDKAWSMPSCCACGLNLAPVPVRRLLFLVNPHAGSGSASRRMASIIPLLQHSGHAYKVIETRHANHAYELSRDLHLNECDGVVIVSGDGLLYEVVNGLMSRPDWLEAVQRITIGTIAGGSGNGMAASLCYVSREANELVNQAFLIVKGHIRRLDLVSCQREQQPILFSVLSLGWAIISDVDFASEKYRCCGNFRFTFAGLLSIANPK